MDLLSLLSICTIVLMASGICQAEDVKIETTPHIKAYMGHSPTLVCNYVFGTETTEESNWMFIRWLRLVDGSEPIPLAIMQNSKFAAEWMAKAPANFKDHVELTKDIKADHISLNMRIDGFMCTDAGTYRCQVFTHAGDMQGETTLEIEAHPGSPSILEHTVEVSENQTFSIECSANVGRPANVIRWAQKLAGRNIYQLVTSGIRQDNSNTSDCTYHGRSYLSLTMTEKLDGATYMCSTTSELGDKGTPKNFDEVILYLHGKSTTTVTPPTTEKVTMAARIDGASDAGSIALSMTVLLCSLLSMLAHS